MLSVLCELKRKKVTNDISDHHRLCLLGSGFRLPLRFRSTRPRSDPHRPNCRRHSDSPWNPRRSSPRSRRRWSRHPWRRRRGGGTSRSDGRRPTNRPRHHHRTIRNSQREGTLGANVGRCRRLRGLEQLAIIQTY